MKQIIEKIVIQLAKEYVIETDLDKRLEIDARTYSFIEVNFYDEDIITHKNNYETLKHYYAAIYNGKK